MALRRTPTGAPRQRRHHPAQWAMLALNILVITACFVGAGALLFSKRTTDNIPRVAIPNLDSPVRVTTPPVTIDGITLPPSTAPTETFPPADPEARNFLITGSDRNACVDPGSPWAGAADPSRIGTDNTDTIMVMRIDPVANRAAVLSFPRDLWVSIPGRNGKQRINSVYEPGNPALLIETIALNFGVPIDHYIQVDFCAFKRIVDAVGGVSVPFDTPIKDDNVQLLIPTAGCHRFVGDEALAYVRSRKLRYQDASGKWIQDTGYDFGRIARQQDFLWRTLDAALNKGVLDPSVAKGLYDTLLTDVVLDSGLTIDVMLQFVGVMRSVDPQSIKTYQIEASRLLLPNADVLEPELDGDNMRQILSIFTGQSSLAAAPEQTITTDVDTVPETDVDTVPETDGDTITTDPTTSDPAGVSNPPAGDPTDTEVSGAIVPSKDVVCP